MLTFKICVFAVLCTSNQLWLVGQERVCNSIKFLLSFILFYIHSRVEKRVLCFQCFLILAKAILLPIITLRSSVFECEHLRPIYGTYKQFFNVRRSAGWRSNLKDCSSNRTERKIMRKIMRKERTINRWRRTMKWERGRISPISIHAHTHKLAIRPVWSSVRQVMAGQALHACLF